jgi:Domain of unknown function (DUF5615)
VKLRFQADADLNEDIVKGVLRREPGIDFRTATSADLRGLKDLELLMLAAREGRILVSHDRKTMPRASAEFIQTKTSPGLLLVSQKTDLLIVIDSVLLAWMASDAEDWTNRIVSIPLWGGKRDSEPFKKRRAQCHADHAGFAGGVEMAGHGIADHRFQFIESVGFGKMEKPSARA